MSKYVITIELEMNPNETVEGCRLGLPSRWDMTALLSNGGFSVQANYLTGYEACCESYVDWATSDPDTRFPQGEFDDYLHDDECVHFVAIDDGDDDEEMPSDAEVAIVFGEAQTVDLP